MDGYFKSKEEGRYVTRRFDISLGYRFGKMDANVKKARRSSSGESQDDVGSGMKSAGGM